MVSKKLLFGVLILIIASIYFFRAEAPIEDVVEEVVIEESSGPEYYIIGQSVEGRDIGMYKFGEGDTNIAFVGGIHGGYEWNSTYLAYEFIDYFTDNSELIPDNITISIIPSSNPDGLFDVTSKDGRFELSDVSTVDTVLTEARFNANGVDLNRNFACNWKPESTWRSRVVSAGTEAFSEPEAKAILSFVELHNPQSVIFWHSQASTVYASRCGDTVLPETLELMTRYSESAGYNAEPFFDAYEVTGAAEDWLSSIGIPSLTVELTTHETIDWEKNLLGVNSVIEYFSSK